MNRKAAITTTAFGEHGSGPMELLIKNGFEVVRNEFRRVLSKDEIPALCDGCVGIIAGTEGYDHDTLKKLRCLKVISRVGVGLDSIDIEAADKLNIRVVNTPFGPVDAVAELTVSLTLNLLRKVSSMDRGIRTGKWQKETGNLLHAKKVGIVGYGKIGQRVAELLTAFGCETAYYDRIIDSGKTRTKPMPLADLLEWAEIISIHISGKEMIIGEGELMRMKKGSWLINVSRGGTVDEKALYTALKERRLSGAAIDVFSEEPYKGALKELDNVILTPHIGSYAVESRREMEMDAVKNMIKILNEVDR